MHTLDPIEKLAPRDVVAVVLEVGASAPADERCARLTERRVAPFRLARPARRQYKPAMRHFNTAGPCDAELHYMVDPAARLPEAWKLVEERAYFVLSAQQLSGKTTALYALAEGLNTKGRHAAAVLSLEVGAAFTEDIERLEPAILDAWRGRCRQQLREDQQPPPWPDAPAGRRIGAALEAWALASPKPLVLFLDEVDALQGDALITVLRQLRDGFAARPRAFPSTIALVGMRDVRDYVVASGGSGRLGSASPFNIKVRSLTLADFTRDEVGVLLAQHANDTGQRFDDAALDRAFALTRGQPWLVNAVARECVEELVRDRGTAIAEADVDRAGEVLVRHMDTHLDSLAERLREPRVRGIIEPILAGEHLGEVSRDDLRYVHDLGIARVTERAGVEIANPIYREIVARVLGDTPRASLPATDPQWLSPDGKLLPEVLLESFLVFWRQHGEALMGAAPYHEVAPHLVLLAYLDRVANGGGRVVREYAIGSGRMDVLLTRGDVRVAIELKVWRDGKRDPRGEGLEQLDRYLRGLSLDEGWLVIFDRRSRLPPLEERTVVERTTTPVGRTAVVIRG